MAPISYKQFKASDVHLKDPEKMKSGNGYMIPVTAAGGGPLEIQGCPCRLPWDCGEVQEGYGGQGAPQAKLALQLDPEEGGDTFQRVIESLESMCMDKILKSPELNSGRKKMNKDVIAVQFTSSIKQNDEKYLPFLSCKQPFDQNEACSQYGLGKVTTSVFSPDRQTLPPERTLCKGAVVVPIVTAAYCWSISGRFGLTLRVNRVLLVRPAQRESNFDFDISDDLEGRFEPYNASDAAAGAEMGGNACFATASSSGFNGQSAEFVPYEAGGGGGGGEGDHDVGGIPVM